MIRQSLRQITVLVVASPRQNRYYPRLELWASMLWRGTFGCGNEKNLPTKQDQARQNAWLPGPHGDPGRAPGAGETARQGPSAHFGLNSRVSLPAARYPATMSAFGFPRAARLLRPSDYRAVFAKARVKVSRRHFLLLALPGSPSQARLGVVVSRKNVPAAVQRNRVKRLVRESYRRNRARLVGADLVVLARKGAHELENAAIHRETVALWNGLAAKLRTSTPNNGNPRNP